MFFFMLTLNLYLSVLSTFGFELYFSVLPALYWESLKTVLNALLNINDYFFGFTLYIY